MPKVRIMPVAGKKSGVHVQEGTDDDQTGACLVLVSEPLDCNSHSRDEDVGFEGVLACPIPEDWREEFHLDGVVIGQPPHVLTDQEMQPWGIFKSSLTPGVFVCALTTVEEVRTQLEPVAENVRLARPDNKFQRNVSWGRHLLCNIGGTADSEIHCCSSERVDENNDLGLRAVEA